MARIAGALGCALAALLLFLGYRGWNAQLDQAPIRPALLVGVQQVSLPDAAPQYLPIIELEEDGQPRRITLFHRLPGRGLLPITTGADGRKTSRAISAQAIFETGQVRYGTDIAYFKDPTRICFAKSYRTTLDEQRLFLLIVCGALGAGLLTALLLFLLGRRYPTGWDISRRRRKPGYVGPCVLLLISLGCCWAVSYYSNPLFNPNWLLVRATAQKPQGTQTQYSAMTDRGVTQLPGRILPFDFSPGQVNDVYYDQKHEKIRLVPMESISVLLVLVLAPMGAMGLPTACFRLEERRRLRLLWDATLLEEKNTEKKSE